MNSAMILKISGGDSNKMKKLYERLITGAGIAVLVAIFCHQVAYGQQFTRACRMGFFFGMG
jgi:hypothetical protein